MTVLRNRILTYGISGVLAVAAPLAANYEGLRLKAYLDPVGIPTACYGTTLDIRLGMTFTRGQCEEFMKRDMEAAIRIVDQSAAVPLGVYQRAAFASFVYNVGPTKFRKSTMLALINAGDIHGACNQLSRWVHAGGKVLKGLVRRRAAERELCLRGLDVDNS